MKFINLRYESDFFSSTLIRKCFIIQHEMLCAENFPKEYWLFKQLKIVNNYLLLQLANAYFIKSKCVELPCAKAARFRFRFILISLWMIKLESMFSLKLCCSSFYIFFLNKSICRKRSSIWWTLPFSFLFASATLTLQQSTCVMPITQIK